jgi:hypothetical protein
MWSLAQEVCQLRLAMRDLRHPAFSASGRCAGRVSVRFHKLLPSGTGIVQGNWYQSIRKPEFRPCHLPVDCPREQLGIHPLDPCDWFYGAGSRGFVLSRSERKAAFFATLPGALFALGCWLLLSYVLGMYFREPARVLCSVPWAVRANHAETRQLPRTAYPKGPVKPPFRRESQSRTAMSGWRAPACTSQGS